MKKISFKGCFPPAPAGCRAVWVLAALAWILLTGHGAWADALSGKKQVREFLESLSTEYQVEVTGLDEMADETIILESRDKPVPDIMRDILRQLGVRNFIFRFTDGRLKQVLIREASQKGPSHPSGGPGPRIEDRPSDDDRQPEASQQDVPEPSQETEAVSAAESSTPENQGDAPLESGSAPPGEAASDQEADAGQQPNEAAAEQEANAGQQPDEAAGSPDGETQAPQTAPVQ